MGLDSFKNDSDNEDSGVSDSSDNGSDESSMAGGDEKDNETGLDSFNTNTNRGGITQETDSDNQNNKLYGIEPHKWNDMSVKERVAKVRDSKIPDYKPEVQLDERWSHAEVIEVECVCGNVFHFVTTGLCFVCGRSYAKRNRTVVKLNDPEGVTIHNNASEH